MKTTTSLVAALLLAGGSLAHANGPLKTIRGSVPGLVKTEASVGPTNKGQEISVSIILKNRNQAELNGLTRKLNEGKQEPPVTQAQWNEKFAPSKAQLAEVSAWAEKQGLKVTNTKSGDVQVAGSAEKVENAFGVKINDYKVNNGFANGIFHSNVNNPKVPKSLPIKAVIGLDNFPVAEPLSGRPAMAPIAK